MENAVPAKILWTQEDSESHPGDGIRRMWRIVEIRTRTVLQGIVHEPGRVLEWSEWGDRGLDATGTRRWTRWSVDAGHEILMKSFWP